MKPAPCRPASSAHALLHVTEREGTNGAPCLGVAIVMGSLFWLSVSTLLVLAA